MSSGKIVKVDIGGGATYNLWEPTADDPRLWEDTARDLAIAIRGESFNRDLGITDMYLAAGEWRFAIEEMGAVLNEDEFVSPVVNALLLRSTRMLEEANKGSELE